MEFERETEEINASLPPIEIPMESLSQEALLGLVEAFILREGTDYGVNEISLDKKKEQIFRQLEKKDIRVVYDFNTETVTLLTRDELAKHLRS